MWTIFTKLEKDLKLNAMKSSDSTMLSFYQLLGRVFYAAAQADKVVREEEVETLKKLVREIWLDLEDATDAFNEDAAYQIEIVFDYLLQNDLDADSVLQELTDFKNEHSSVFTPEVVEMIMTTTSKIISSFAQTNKSEVVYLSQLHMILRK